MPVRTPAWLANRCSGRRPTLFRAIDGRRMIDTVAAIVANDRWTSFDRYHETTQLLVDEYEQAGAATDVHRIATGGQIGSCTP